MKACRYPVLAKLALAAVLVAGGLSVATEAHAAYTVRLVQVGADVVANGSGTLNLAGFYRGGAGGGSGLYAKGAVFGIGPVGTSIDEDAYGASVTGPTSYGTGDYVSPSAGSGDLVEIYRTTGYIYVYRGYVSGSPLASTAVWKGATIASLGLTPGTYTWTWGSGANADSFTLIIDDVPAPANYQGLWWNAPGGSESGWGINFAHQGDVVFATWFTYDAAGKPWWLIAELHKDAGATYSGPVSTVAGPPFNAVPFAPAPVETQVGTMTATFSDATHGTLSYTVNGITQTKSIVPQQFGPLTTCAWGAQPNLALATNYTDLWWNAAESGWGVNFTHQGDIVFATWFTYDAAGKPWWLIAELHKGANATYSGPVSTVSGQAFNTVPWNTSAIVETGVGTATVTFANGNGATLAYTVNGVTQSKAIARQVFAPPGTVCQ
jgi:hypothetical protein